MVIDLKTTFDASAHAFSRVIANLFYHLQAAFYLDGISKVTGHSFHRFALIAVEKTPPFAVATYVLDEATIEVGRMLYRKALKTLRECQTRDFYPAYPDRLLSTSLPSWAWPVESDGGDIDVRAI